MADRELAGSYLNYLLDRDPGSPIEVDASDFVLEDVPAWRVLAATDTDEQQTLDEATGSALRTRPELRQLEYGLDGAEAAVSAARWSRLPSLALAVDAGVQGTVYRFGEDNRYLMASLLLQWNVAPWGAEGAQLRRARLERDRVAAQRRNVARRIQLEVETATRNARVAVSGVETARERERAASDAFRLVSRRQSEGLATPLEFLDARAALTRARLSLSITETEALISLAELEFATGSVAPADTRLTDQENDR